MTERPNCKACGKPLRAYFTSEWLINQTRPAPGTRKHEGFGFLGNNHFCSKGCGYDWACAFHDKLEAQRKGAA